MMTDSVRSYGGAAGEAAVTEDLERGARIIAGAAELLDAAGGELRDAAGYTDTALRRGSAPTRHAAASASDALWEAQWASRGSAATSLEARDLADRLSRVAECFLEAEQDAMAHVSGATRVRAAAGSAWGTGLWLARHAAAATLGAVPSPLSMTALGRGMLNGIRPDGLPPTTGLLNKDSSQFLMAGQDGSILGFAAKVYALAAVTAGLEALFGEGHASTVEPRESSYPPRQPRGVEDVMVGLQAEENRMDGAVSIETITHADGTHSYVVTIPGTEDWGVESENPHDLQGNLAAMAKQSTDAQQAVVDAMRAAGIGPGEEVMLAGHSQGGINAVALASRPAFLDEFNVTHVVTAGAPVGRMALPASVQALHLEHTEDVVSGLDATPNPATATRTTVERDLTLSGDPRMEALGRDLVGAHHLSSYASTAALVDAGQAGTSATVWRDTAAGFFTGEPSTLAEYVPVAPAAAISGPASAVPRPSPGPSPEPPPEAGPPSEADTQPATGPELVPEPRTPGS